MLTDVVTYFQSVMSDVGFTYEHEDALNFENVPSNKKNIAYHIGIGQFRRRVQNQTLLDSEMPVTITFWVKGFRNTVEARNSALSKTDDVLCKAISIQRVTQQNYIKNIEFDDSLLEKLAESNDNIIKVTMNFRARLMMSPQ